MDLEFSVLQVHRKVPTRPLLLVSSLPKKFAMTWNSGEGDVDCSGSKVTAFYNN